MGWVFFEVALVIGVAAAIVWWTFPREPRKPSGEDKERPGPGG